MVFSSEKKELWRYASINNANCSVGAGNSRQQQLHRHQNLHHLQSPPPDYFATTTTHLNSRLTQNQQKREQQEAANAEQEEEEERTAVEENNTPPPPYSSVPCGIDFSDTCRRMSTTSGESIDLIGGSAEHFTVGSMTNYINGKSRTLRSASKKSVASFGCSSNNKKKLNMERNEHDCYYNHNNNINKIYNMHENGSTIFNHKVFVYDQLRKKKSALNCSAPNTNSATAITAPTTSIVTCTAASVLAATAASIFRNCCGGGGGVDGAVLGEESKVSPATSTATVTTIVCHKGNNNNCNLSVPRQYFDALLKQMKEGQVTALLKAVKSRLELVQQTQQQQQSTHHHHTFQAYEQQQVHYCILIHGTKIMNEDPYVIVCRLFFWPKLKGAIDLKRLPDCPKDCNPVYVCCNPLHWYRIVSAETAPPPYQLQSKTLGRLQLEDTILEKNYQNGRSHSSVNVSSLNLLVNQQNIMQNKGFCVQIPESVATAGEGKKPNLIDFG